MSIKVVSIGKTNETYVQSGLKEYLKRCQKYVKVEFIALPDVKNGGKLSPSALCIKEGEKLLQWSNGAHQLILLDAGGKELSSEAFGQWLGQRMANATQNICFVIGGAYGFSEEVYRASSGKISLSKMTFNHQMVRLIFIEQLYRALNLLHGGKYHH